jgi:hypothetical protein
VRAPRRKQLEVASTLAGTAIAHADLLALKQRRAWRELWVQLRDFDTELQAAREELVGAFPKAAKVYRKAVDVAHHELTRGTDKLSAVRAVPPLLAPMFDRVLPKPDAPMPLVGGGVHITVTVERAERLDAPEIVVEAEEVEAEVVEVVEIDGTSPVE